FLGPLAPFDQMSKNLVLTMARGGMAPPNHWSVAWVALQRGMAHAAIGEIEQARQQLQAAVLVAGQYDHPLTGMALLELGRLALVAGDFDAAARNLAEASYSGFVFEDPGVIDEAFRLAAENQLARGAGGADPALVVAAEWARRERFDHIASRIQLALSEQLMLAGNWDAAASALVAAGGRMTNARTGPLGNRALFLDAKLDFYAGRGSGEAKLATAVEGQAAMSLQNFQIGLANTMFDAQTLPTRSAPAVYETLLADPAPADAAVRMLESMAVMQTVHEEAFYRWLVAAVERGNLGAAIEVTDRTKRRRFHNAAPWGGRLAAIRTLVAGAAPLQPRWHQQRNEVLSRYPQLRDALADVASLRKRLQQSWQPALEDDARRQVTDWWKSYAAAIDQREALLGNVALAPIPAELSFPPLLTAAELQPRLSPGQTLVVFHDTPDGLLGIALTSKGASSWNCGPSARLAGPLSTLLRALGNYDANREMTAEALSDDEWQQASRELYDALFDGSSLVPSAIKELIIVPDGLTWYVPFEALVPPTDVQPGPLVDLATVRYAPTVGLAFRFNGVWRRVQRTGIVTSPPAAGKQPQDHVDAIASLAAATPGPFPLDATAADAPSPTLATLLDAVIVLTDVDAVNADPLAWSPMPLDRAERAGSIDRWLTLPGDGPQRILLPSMHTLAERGGKAPRRRGAPLAGSELYYASCSLMSAGAETLLLSRWRVGGQSTLDLMREFAQELPNTPAAAAWQRSVHLARDTPVDPAAEMRVKADAHAGELTARHPFFWAGYMVVDSGWKPADEDEGAAPDPAPPVAAAAAAGADGS
ncbi:MAG TPA: CHAT domain-containing protein, partial [Lacipirellulaceae bacterium]|nr:CHAT domain-containing protein [Lacipirellulaceae bacterium]